MHTYTISTNQLTPLCYRTFINKDDYDVILSINKADRLGIFDIDIIYSRTKI